MCGNSSREASGGALAVLNVPPGNARSMPPNTAGRLTFHASAHDSVLATHATFAAERNGNSHFGDLDACVIAKHETGDLTRSVTLTPFLYKFRLAAKRPSSTSFSDSSSSSSGSSFYNHNEKGDSDASMTRRSIEVELCQPMKIGVGGDGIIGRRVSVWTSPHAANPIAEGIIGYN